MTTFIVIALLVIIAIQSAALCVNAVDRSLWEQAMAENIRLKIDLSNTRLAMKPTGQILAIALNSSLTHEEKVNKVIEYAEKFTAANSVNPETP